MEMEGFIGLSTRSSCIGRQKLMGLGGGAAVSAKTIVFSFSFFRQAGPLGLHASMLAVCVAGGALLRLW